MGYRSFPTAPHDLGDPGICRSRLWRWRSEARPVFTHGTGHGWFYFIYLITAVDLTFRMRWSPIATILILLAGTIPLASFFADIG